MIYGKKLIIDIIIIKTFFLNIVYSFYKSTHSYYKWKKGYGDYPQVLVQEYSYMLKDFHVLYSNLYYK